MDNSELLIIAQEYGTPTFVFDVEEFWRRLDKVADIFDDEVRLCFAWASPHRRSCTRA